jgi:hypothetical protein
MIFLQSSGRRMAKVPPIEEREFLKLTQNHSEFRRKIQVLGHEKVASDVTEIAYHVGLCWLQFACEHMQDARALWLRAAIVQHIPDPTTQRTTLRNRYDTS